MYHNFSEAKLPEALSLMAAGGPVFSTSLVETSGGFEQRNINWANARMRYNLAPAIRTETDLQFILNFFRSHKGRAIGFRFKDWTDFKAINVLITVADGLQSKFRLCKRYDDEVRVINKPVPGTVNIYVNDVLQSAEINYSTGEFAFAEPPAQGSKISADFEFDVFARFNTDEIIINTDLDYIENLEIPIIEIKVI